MDLDSSALRWAESRQIHDYPIQPILEKVLVNLPRERLRIEVLRRDRAYGIVGATRAIKPVKSTRGISSQGTNLSHKTYCTLSLPLSVASQPGIGPQLMKAFSVLRGGTTSSSRTGQKDSGCIVMLPFFVHIFTLAPTGGERLWPGLNPLLHDYER
jgi:hypothetical protein